MKENIFVIFLGEVCLTGKGGKIQIRKFRDGSKKDELVNIFDSPGVWVGFPYHPRVMSFPERQYSGKIGKWIRRGNLEFSDKFPKNSSNQNSTSIDHLPRPTLLLINNIIYCAERVFS